MDLNSIATMKFVFAPFFVFFLVKFDICQGIDGRIFDGADANITDYPWMVSIRLGNVNHLCGGAILSDQFVLTAASCFPSILATLPSVFVLKAGINQLVGGNESTEQTRSISQIIPHPHFNMGRPNENNLALALLSTPWNLNDSGVSSISLSNLTVLDGVDLITIGWGFGNPANPSAPKYLQEKVIQEDANCTSRELTNSSIQLCAEGQ